MKSIPTLKKNTPNGFTLIEVMVSLFVISVILIGVYSLIILALKLTSENKYYVEAIGIANQQMERIRNMPYDQVGVSGGIPSGAIPQVETITRGGTYTANYYVTFYDDPYDGQIGSSTKPDTIPVDYKIVTVKISWEGKVGPRNVTVFSKVIPRTEETTSGYGLLKISVVNANASPVSGASVRIINNLLSPAVDVTNLTDTEGLLYIPALESFQGYQIIVTKSGYTTDQTYPISAENPEPTKINLSVTEGNKTEESFTIDQLATLHIQTVSNNLPPNWQVNQEQTGSEKSAIKSTSDSSDNLYFTWQSTDSASSTVYIQKFDTTLTRQWTNDKRIYTSSSHQTNPAIAATQSGQTFIVWQDNSLTLKALALSDKHNNYSAIKQNQAYKDTFSNQKRNSFLLTLEKILQDSKVFLSSSWRKAYSHFKSSLYLAQTKIRTQLSFAGSLLSKEYFKNQSVSAATTDVAFVGVGPGAVTGAINGITLSVPSGIQNGDLLIAYIYNDDYSDGPMIAPSGYGWQTLTTDLQPSCSALESWWWGYCDSRGAIFWKIVVAGDPASYNFILSGGHSSRKAGHIRAYRNVDPLDPFDGSLLTQTTNAGNLIRPAPSQTVNNNGSMLVCGWGSSISDLGDVSGGPTFPAGMTNSINNYGTDVTAASADKTVNITDSPTGPKNYDARKTVDDKSINWSLIIKPAVLPDNVNVSAIGTQVSPFLIPQTDQYLGGAFVVAETNSVHTINSITLTESGTVDAKNNLTNIKLFYDLDTTAPYDCSDESYDSGLDAQFGSASSFSSANGTSTFTQAGGVEVNTTKSLCLYVVLDIGSGAIKDDSIEISINNPSTDIILNSGNAIPTSSVDLSGTTFLKTPALLDQIHYRWRSDDGSELDANWKQGQDSPDTTLQNTNVRLRFEISNQGSFNSSATDFQLEYGEKVSTCSAISSWIPVPTDNSAHWKISDSSFLVNGDSTTNSSGIVDENTDFIAGETLDTTNTSSSMTIGSTEFTEIEYSILATSNSLDSFYCFRLTNSGSTFGISYTVYPEISIIGDDNIFLISYDSNGNQVWGPKKINTENSASQQILPRIAATENFGTATSVITWEDGRNGQSDIYAQSFDVNGNKIWSSDLEVFASSDSDSAPAITITNDDNIYIAWSHNDSSINKDIYLHKFDLSGNNVWSNAIIVASSANDEYQPAITKDDTGNVYVIWTQYNGAIKNIRFAKIDPSGSILWEKAANAGSFEYDQLEPAILYSNSYIYTAWTDTREGNEDIYTQKFSTDGDSQWSNDQRININIGTSIQNSPTLTVNSSGNTFGAWTDSRNSQADLFATKYSDPGSLTGIAGVPIIISGTQRIGENPIILKYELSTTTDSGGFINLTLDWDSSGYTIDTYSASTSLNMIFSDPVQPVSILPAENKTVLIYVE